MKSNDDNVFSKYSHTLIYCSVLLEEKCLPSLESILEMRTNKACFFLFCEYFLSRIVGMTIWKDSCTKQKVSEKMTVSDEVFTYLLIENYWDEWSTKSLDEYMQEVSYDSSTSKRKKRKSTWQKYTKGALGACHYGGWNQDGIIRFNQYVRRLRRTEKIILSQKSFIKLIVWQQQITPKKWKQRSESLILMLMTWLTFFNSINESILNTYFCYFFSSCMYWLN